MSAIPNEHEDVVGAPEQPMKVAVELNLTRTVTGAPRLQTHIKAGSEVGSTVFQVIPFRVVQVTPIRVFQVTPI